MTSSRARTIAALAAASILVSAFAVGAGARTRVDRAPTRATKIVKGIGAGHWSPTIVRISVGDLIKWKAVSNTHTVTAYGGAWHLDQNLNIGRPVTFRFTHAGTFFFRCRFHSSMNGNRCSGMCGKVIVSSS